ncbi:hypothetical protein pEaSNUABM29_00264 [Erwinia phage pEa_SNUABM_29]|nr:hypothetical protein pEaSNUABM29_00264 [Erwinia phage pEa_SNUABM_29]
MKTYPYDPRGINPECHFTEERIIESDDPKDRVVMLDHRPFFDSLVVTLAGSSIPLTRGTDYELEYALTPLDDSVASAVFCGVHLINPKLRGAVIFDGQMLGGTFYDGLIEMLDELVKALNNPTSADWLLLDNRPALYPATPSATSWADMLNKKYIASAVHDVELDSDAANDAIREKLTELKVQVTSLATEMDAFNFPAHTGAKNPHNTTVAQTNAHPVNLKTPDTFLAYGKNLRQLTSEIRALGLQQSDIDKYISKWVSKDSKGVFNATISGTRAMFRSPNGESDITFATDSFVMKSNGSIVLATGYVPGDTTTRFMEWKAGTNTLRIESSGTVLGMDKLTLNGTTLLTTTALMQYQQDPNQGSGGQTDPDDNKLYIQGQNGISFSGKGSKADPVTGTVTPSKATTTTVGVVKLKKGPGPETTGVASTPDSLTQYEGDLSSYVLKATLLNNKAMDDGSRTMTKADLGLANANNTADVDKPLSDDLSEAVTGLSAKGHHHDWSELQIPDASQTTQGIARYSNNQAGLAAGRGVTPNVLKALSDRLDVVAAALANAKDGTVTDFAAVKNSSWTVSAAKTSLSVTDLKYFFLSNNERKDGSVSGSIDLQTTPMFQWFSQDNRMEDSWNAAVVNTGAGVVWDNIGRPAPFAFQGSQIGVNATQMGDLSVVSVLAKVRVHSVSDKLSIYVAGGGRITVYVDGQQVTSGTSPLFVDVPMTTGWDEHCVAIKAECNDSTKAAALMFDIYDDIYPLYSSGTHTKVALLQEFVTTPKNLRHYLYVNMRTDALYSRAEPILEPSQMNVERGYIGYVDVPATGLTAGATITFDTTFDFGPAKEISAHVDVRKAHGVKSSDWKLSDNLKMLPLNKVKASMQQWGFAQAGSGASGGHVYRPDRGLSDYYFSSTGTTTIETLTVFGNKQASPYCWFTPYNPKENGQPTFEGSFTIDVENPTPMVDKGRVWGLMLLAKANGTTAPHRQIRITSDLKVYYGYINNISNTTPGFTFGVPTQTFKELVVTPTVLSDTTLPTGDALDFVDLGTNGKPGFLSTRWAVRYRYNCNTRVLRLSIISSKIGTNTLRALEVEIPFAIDLLDYFAGFGMAVHMGAVDANERIRVSHALMNPGGAVDVDKYQYLRSLLESYTDWSMETERTGFESYVATSALPNASGDNLDYPVTEWVALPVGQDGNAELSHRGQLPLPFHSALAERGTLIAKQSTLPAGYQWNGAWDSTKMKRRSIWRDGLILCYRQDKNAPIAIKEISGTITSNYPGLIIIGSNAVTANNRTTFLAATSATDAKTVNLQPTNLKPGQSVFIALNAPDAIGATGLNVKFNLVLKDHAGTVVKTLTEADAGWELRSNGGIHLMEKRTPFHITSAAWQWLSSELVRERTNDGNGVGEWAS